MRQYELTYLISDDVQESEITKITGKIGGIIAEEKGKVLKEESWGRRKLAYPIKKLLFATYITTNFELEPENLKNIERDSRHESKIIRYLLIVKDLGKEKLSLSAEDVAATKEIEEVVGGEKSFEAVEGMTDESLDLMAKRTNADNETAPTLQQDVEDRSPNRSVGKESKDLMAIRGEAKETEELKNERTKELKKEPEIIEKKPVAKPIAEKGEKIEKITKKPRPKADQPMAEVVEKAKPIAKVEKAEDKKAVIAKPIDRLKQSNAKKIATAKDGLAMTDDKPKEVAKPIKKKAIKKDSSASDEADRLAKLDEELNDILGEEL